MTEIALALAMGFFSILVLALVSMGGGHGEKVVQTQSADLLKPALSHAQSEATHADPNDQIVIFHGGKLIDDALQPLDPAQLDPAKRVILAFDPSLPLDRIMAVYAELKHPDIVISALDARWREALSRAPAEAKR